MGAFFLSCFFLSFSLIFFFISFRQRKLAKWQYRRNSDVVVLSACCFGYKCQGIQLKWRLYSLVLRLRISSTTASFVFYDMFYDVCLKYGYIWNKAASDLRKDCLCCVKISVADHLITSQTQIRISSIVIPSLWSSVSEFLVFNLEIIFVIDCRIIHIYIHVHVLFKVPSNLHIIGVGNSFVW